MVQVEVNNMYISIGANNGSEKLWKKNMFIFFVQISQIGYSIIPYLLD